MKVQRMTSSSLRHRQNPLELTDFPAGWGRVFYFILLFTSQVTMLCHLRSSSAL